MIEYLERRRLLTSYPIDGVQPVAFDQPQIHGLFKLSANGAPLLADDGAGDTSFDVQGFLDTGTSGILLSQETSQGLNIQSETVSGNPATFTDIGIGGGEQFDVSQTLYTSLANFSPAIDGTDATTF